MKAVGKYFSNFSTKTKRRIQIMPYFGPGVAPGICKFVGYNVGKTAGYGYVGHGMCLGLGLGLGVLGPILVIGAGVAGGYFLIEKFKTVKMNAAAEKAS
jgi:hypothetical protein